MYERDWDERVLELNNPKIMDTPTFIEWIQRQLESPEETKARHAELDEKHAEWHRNTPGIFSCCIKIGTLSMNDVGEGEFDATKIQVGTINFATGEKGWL